MMDFRKGGGRRKVVDFTWGTEKIEIVREFTYLGYKLQENNGEEKHVKYIAAKARAVMGRIWSIGERLCREGGRRE